MCSFCLIGIEKSEIQTHITISLYNIKNIIMTTITVSIQYTFLKMIDSFKTTKEDHPEGYPVHLLLFLYFIIVDCFTYLSIDLLWFELHRYALKFNQKVYKLANMFILSYWHRKE